MKIKEYNTIFNVYISIIIKIFFLFIIQIQVPMYKSFLNKN